MPVILKRLPLLFVFALLCSCSHSPTVEAGSGAATSATPTFKTLQGSSGGTLVFGPLGGQQTYQNALSIMLKKVEADYGDRPQMGSLLQSKNGNFWEGFFTFANKKQNSTAMTGLVIVYAPQTGNAGGATLIDTTANFPKSVNPMFQLLVKTVTNSAPASGTASAGPSGSSGSSASSGAASSGPAQPLTTVAFPDGSAKIGLPQGWKVSHAQQGDVGANGPNGEVLRFGLRIFVVDPTNPQSRTLTGGRPSASLFSVPYSADPNTLFTQILTQAAQKQRAAAPTINITNTQTLGAQNFMVYANINNNDGKGAQMMVAQLTRSPVMMGEYQVTIYDIAGPTQAMQQDASTIGAIYSSYAQNGQQMMAITNSQIQQGIAQEKQTLSMINSYTQSSDLMTQGMSDELRGESVFVDSDTGEHYRGPDDLASALSNANPDRFQTLSLGQYIQGVDY